VSSTYPFVPAATLEGIVWPAAPVGDAAAVFAILDQLGQSQWWPPALLRRQQRAQLAALVAHASRTVPFYRRPGDRGHGRQGFAFSLSYCEAIPRGPGSKYEEFRSELVE
jgi:hypothetical protein